MRFWVLFAASILIITVSCTADQAPDDVVELPETNVCTPGKSESCACVGGGQGAQTCKEDGSGYEECNCPDVNEQDIQNDDTKEDTQSAEDFFEDPSEELDTEQDGEIIEEVDSQDSSPEETTDTTEEELESLCQDLDGDNHPGSGEGCEHFDCDETRNDVYQGAEELCDEVDNDCDGDIDEDFICCGEVIQPCYSGPNGTSNIGSCREGIQRCTDDNTWSDCEEEIFPEDENCSNMEEDNDCNGVNDDILGIGEECVSGAPGVCGSGVRQCIDAELICVPGEPEEEICDGMDNNCNGSADEGVTQECYSGPEDTEGVGICHSGRQSCFDGEFGICTGEVLPNEERVAGTCDGLDNNCDGLIDEDLGCCGEPDQACYSGSEDTRGIGICQDGIQECLSDATWGSCVGESIPDTESCLNMDEDNNCDGIIDNIVGLGDVCDTGEGGICRQGIRQCNDGVLDCVAFNQSVNELCDGLDNNCDGNVDEGITESCFSGPEIADNIGVCRSGLRNCVEGELGICEGEILPSDEGIECDGLDNNCDGEVDEGVLVVCYTGPNNTGGVGICQAGIQGCSSGDLDICDGEVLPELEGD